MFNRLLPVYLMLCSLVWAHVGHSETVHVSPDGRNGAVTTLQQARDRIRAMKASGPLTEPVTVVVADGTYRLTQPFVLTPEDSGTASCPITYACAPGARPVITGGRAITGFKPGKNGLWQVRIPEAAAGKWVFESLFVDGRRGVRARTPNKGYYHMMGTSEVALKGGRDLFRRTTEVRSDALSLIKGLSPETLKQVTLVAHHKWCISRRFLSAIDTGDSAIISIGEKLKGYSGWPVNTRFWLENIEAALDAPGEWFLHRDGTLYYKPLPGQDMTRAEVIAPVAGKLVVFQGEPEKNRFVEHVTLKGLTFSHNHYPLPRSGYAPFQAAFVTEAAVMADGARHVAVKDCEISHTGDYAIWFRRGCRDCRVERCFLHDLASGGVRIGEGRIRPNEAERTHHITVDNNIIYHGGRTYTSAVGVWIGQSGRNSITHNEIADFYYTGISAGWRWGYTDGLAQGNIIRFNHIHHLGQWVLSDMGGIYTLGPSQGTVVSNNIFHDIYAYSYGGWGLYTDEGSTGITMENNLVYNTKTGSFHQHYGKDNIVRNNILAFSLLHQVQASRVENHRSFTFDRNIVIWNTGALLAGAWHRIKVDMDHNWYHQVDGESFTFAGKDLKAWQAMGYDKHARIGDPGFVDAQNGDFHLKPDAPVLKAGFKPFDFDKAGVYGDPGWIKKAKDLKMPNMTQPPGPPPMSVRDDFEKTPVGGSLRGGRVHVEKKGDAVAVTGEAAAGGKRCLKVTDAEGLKYAYNPHFYYSPEHKQGVTTCRFDLRIEKNTRLNYEWRDWRGSPYQVGPQFRVDKGKLISQGKPLLDLPAAAWVRIEIRSALGKGNGGTWDLTITLPGKAPKAFKGLKHTAPHFEMLTWLGFTSDATWKTHFFLDNFFLENKPTRGTARLDPAVQGKVDAVVKAFMEKYNVPGLSIAMARRGKCVLRKGYGVADKENAAAVTPAHRFRIASVSKPVTAVAILRLMEQGRLSLDDKVFGKGGLLGRRFKADGEFIRQIRVRHLLNHTAGPEWSNKKNDPMFLNPALGHAALIAWTLKHKPLTRAPGSIYAYSNFGYCLLGRVIEAVSGGSYEAFVQSAVLKPCGIEGFAMAGNAEKDRQAGEVKYYGQRGRSPYGMPVSRMDAHGGWIATAGDLVRFALRVDGFPSPPDILKPETIRLMVKPSSANEGYASGWAVNPQGNWWHMGSLPGTASVLVRTSGGMCWAALVNTRHPDREFRRDLDRLPWAVASSL